MRLSYPATGAAARRAPAITRVQALLRDARALPADATSTVQLRPRALLVIFIRTVRVMEAPGASERTDQAAAFVRLGARADRFADAFEVVRAARARATNVAPAGTARQRIVAGGVLRNRTPWATSLLTFFTLMR